jgi:hypothetical protein
MTTQPEQPDEDAPEPQGQDAVQPDAEPQEELSTDVKKRKVSPKAKKQEV